MYISAEQIHLQGRMAFTESDLEIMLFAETEEPRALPLSFLENITHGFSDDLITGKGGFAVVYKGILNNGGMVAVKRLSSMYIYDELFLGEVACLMKVKHKNIVRFLGYCAHTKGSMEMYDGKLVMAGTQQRLLCFEYLPKGCLDDYIQDPSGGLEWTERYKIIKGICEALNYLHERKIVHLDLKPKNILLDEYMIPKIADFGNSRCLEEEQTSSIATQVCGTRGYLAPEYVYDNKITYKSDVYSLGVIIKEILTGKKGYQPVENILESWSNRSVISQREQIQVCAEIGIECTDFNPERRPVSMNHIMDRLLETEGTQVIPADGTSELLVLQKLALYFPFKPNKVTTCPLQLTNNTDKVVAFRLMHKSGESFLRLPSYGIVLPRSLYTIIVTTQECRELPLKNNMDLILESNTILINDYINTFHSQPDTYFCKAKRTGNVVQEVPLKAYYTLRPEKIDSSKCMLFEEGTEPKALPFSLLEKITNGFSNKLEIGRGGYAVVYKGMLDNGSNVAVKRISGMYSDTEFQAEVKCLMKVKHKNVVRFLGYCADTKGSMRVHNGKLIMEDTSERLLCFEYLPKGSLEHYIEYSSGGLEWSKQYKIIKGICEGLNYLHQENIMHLDLKAANILLDEFMMPKIINFGHSRCLEEKQMAGTIGYMALDASDYYDEKITYKSDMYSLGVIIIEILTRKWSYDVENVSESWRNMTDRSLWGQIRVCTEIGRECTRIDPSERPVSMKHILDRLLGTESKQIIPEDRPSMGNVVPLKSFYTPRGEMKELSKISQRDGDKGEEIDGNSAHSFNKTRIHINKAAKEWRAKHPLVGRRSEINDLHRCTITALFSSIQIISVWGIAGVGKSALLKNFMCDKILSDCGQLERNMDSLFDKYGWVDASHPFNLTDFSRSLLWSFHAQSLQDNKDLDTDTTGSENPIVECHGIMKKHRCLIIIDDLRSTEEWDLIHAELVSGSSMSCIIVITSDANISKHCRGYKGQIVFNVKCLQADAAFYLFKNEVSRKYPLPYGDFAELQELISKCGGLPKVIVEIAGLLADKSVGRMMDCARSINDNFMHDLENNREFDSLKGLFSWMRTYLGTCPDSLKPYIFYLSIFPRDHIIRRRRLVRRWIAEGYSRDNCEESAEENGENHFSNLLDLSIIQHPPQMMSTTKLNDTRMISCMVNGFMREYIVSRQRAESLVTELGGRSIITTQRTGRHLVILQSWGRDTSEFESMDFSRLRSLTVFGEWRSFFISESMKLLRVLDLEDASGCVKYEDLERIGRLLGRLEFLSMRGRREILHLPNKLGHLRQLQTLDVRGTSIVSFPKNITKLKKLQYIRAGNTDIPASAPTRNVSSSWFSKHSSLVGVKVPRGIGELTALHTLGVVNVSASGSKNFLEDLKKLTQLRKLGVSGINRKNSGQFVGAIKVHIHLESLSVLLDKVDNSQGCWLKMDKNNQDCLDDMIFPPCMNLRSLKLYGLVDKLPNWKANKLTKLELAMSSLTEDGIEMLGRLPKLCILRVKQLQDGLLHFRVIVHKEESYSYEKVKVLEIACSSNELSVTFGSKTMKELELLKVDCSSASSKFKVSGMKNLEELKVVEIVQGPNAETQKRHLCHQLEDHPNEKKPVVKLHSSS